jgi:hypothetical protein
VRTTVADHSAAGPGQPPGLQDRAPRQSATVNGVEAPTLFPPFPFSTIATRAARPALYGGEMARKAGLMEGRGQTPFRKQPTNSEQRRGGEMLPDKDRGCIGHLDTAQSRLKKCQTFANDSELTLGAERYLDHRSVENRPITTFLHENDLFGSSPKSVIEVEGF